MISEKANRKLTALATTIASDKLEGLVAIIVANNVVIEDITRKGELVLKHLDNPAPKPIRIF